MTSTVPIKLNPRSTRTPVLLRGKSLLNANVELINLKNTPSNSTLPQYEERNNASLKVYPVLVPNEVKLLSEPTVLEAFFLPPFPVYPNSITLR